VLIKVGGGVVLVYCLNLRDDKSELRAAGRVCIDDCRSDGRRRRRDRNDMKFGVEFIDYLTEICGCV
jgi:hypothetical protein